MERNSFIPAAASVEYYAHLPGTVKALIIIRIEYLVKFGFLIQ